jgi:AsmA family
MKRPRLTLRRVVLVALLLVIVAVAAAPFLHADSFRRRVHQSLEAALGRKVEIEDVRFSLLRGPGFSLNKVVIHEDPAIGIEPIAYVASMEANVRIGALLTGRLEFSSLRLNEPSVNLVKTPAGPWNFQPLLARAAGADLPEFRVRGGRLNFKFGDTKSVFYFTGTDLDIDPPSGPHGPFDVRFSGEPARTDRPAHGFGKFSGRGRWQPSPSADGRLDLSLDLERSSIGELVTLVHGQDLGIHGRLSATARLRGPIEDVEIAGDLQLQDIHRWDLMPPYAAGGPLRFHGRVDLKSQRLEIETVPERNSALIVRFRASRYLSDPAWGVNVALNRLPVARVLEVVRHMGFSFTDALAAEGEMTGVFGYSPADGLQGSADMLGAKIGLLGNPPAVFEEARLTVAGSRLRLAPAILRTADGETVRLDLDYQQNPEHVDLQVQTEQLSLGGPNGGQSLPAGIGRIPFLDHFRGGAWRGALRYRQDADAPGEWSGAIHMTGTSVAVNGLAAPLAIEDASVKLDGDRVSVTDVKGALGETAIQGDYRHQPGARYPDRIRCRVDRLRAGELERWFTPTLQRQAGLLSRALAFGRAPLPDWLRTRKVEGTLEIGNLTVQGFDFESVRARWFWDGARLEFTRVSARSAQGRIDGHLSIGMAGREPAYDLGVAVESVAWRGGTLGGDARVSTSGFDEELLGRMRAEGTFHGRSVALSSDTELPFISGCYSLSWSGKTPSVELDCLRVGVGTDILTGHAVARDGRISVELSGGAHPLRLAGSLSPIELRLEPPR